MNAYSEDLRKKVINYIESGHSRKEACEVFGICLKSVTNWIKLKRDREFKNRSGSALSAQTFQWGAYCLCDCESGRLHKGNCSTFPV